MLARSGTQTSRDLLDDVLRDFADGKQILLTNRSYDSIGDEPLSARSDVISATLAEFAAGTHPALSVSVRGLLPAASRYTSFAIHCLRDTLPSAEATMQMH